MGWCVVVALVAGAAFTSRSALSQPGPVYEVIVTNVTRGERFTPILVATHSSATSIFALGSPSSPELATLAEEGNTAPLANALMATGDIGGLAVSNGLLDPGQSATIVVPARGRANRISLAAMLIPSNDAFVAINSAELPNGRETLTLYAPAYDAGSERNDELCVSIPGPFFTECGGPGGGGMPSGGEEGFVHIHSGIQGVGDLQPGLRDWKNPVAQVVIRRPGLSWVSSN